jgi:rhamnosyltransferase subunit B
VKVLVTTFGTSGDINPFIAVGMALCKRGHDVVLLINPYFEKQVRDAGLEFVPLGDPIDLRQIAEMPDLMHPRKGLQLTLDMLIVPQMPVTIDAVGSQIRNLRPDIVLSHSTCTGTHWICERYGVPSAGAVLAPLLWPSSKDPSVFLSWEPENPPGWYLRSRNRISRWVLRRIVDPRFNQVRRRYGFPRKRDLYFAETLGGVVNLALWSPHYRGPMSDDPPNGRICGFSWFDRHGEFEHPPLDVEEFLSEGEPPIVFTLGTSAVHVSGSFYDCAAEACRILGRRGILLTRHQEYAPSTLPAGVRAFTYVPFSTVLPRACATVHHGGIGTTAQAMRAGRPTVIIPFSYDQFDNAARAKRLGVSVTLKRSRLSPNTLAQALSSVIDDPMVNSRAARMGELLAVEDGALVAAMALEDAVRGTCFRPAAQSEP